MPHTVYTVLGADDHPTCAANGRRSGSYTTSSRRFCFHRREAWWRRCANKVNRMAKDRVETGSATGWQVEDDAGGGFEWTACGPLGFPPRTRRYARRGRSGRSALRAPADALVRRSENSGPDAYHSTRPCPNWPRRIGTAFHISVGVDTESSLADGDRLLDAQFGPEGPLRGFVLREHKAALRVRPSALVGPAAPPTRCRRDH
jgi:hypothetical protein